jgi:8-oxo-dGTP diphosphatase
MNTKIMIVNDNDEIIEHKNRTSLEKSDIYRVSALWIKNSKGEVLLAKRHLNKKIHPGKWGPAVSGTNELGESYESNIIKEAKEEIGLKGYEFEKSKKTRRFKDYNFFCQWFTLEIDKELEEFTIQKDEVEEIKWFRKDELAKELEENSDGFLESIKDSM